jgi:hypothetical protein
MKTVVLVGRWILKGLRLLAAIFILFGLLLPLMWLYRLFPLKPIGWLDMKIFYLCDWLVPVESAFTR